MEELIRAALAPGKSLRKTILEDVPKLHAQRLSDFSQVVKAPVVVSLWMPDTKERYTARLSETGCEVEDDELVDFPVATLVGQGKLWEAFKPALLTLSLAAEGNRAALQGQLKAPITAEALARFERIEGVIVVTLDDVPGVGQPVVLEVVLNDYTAPAGAPRLEVRLSYALVLEVASGALDPRKVDTSRVKLSGKAALGVELAGFFSGLSGGKR